MAVALGLTGCLGGGDDPPDAAGPARAIGVTLDRLQRATAAGDFATVCSDLLTPAARTRAGGPDCARRTRSAAAGVRRPSIEALAIELDGATARVHVRTRAQGQAGVEDVLLMRRVGGSWKVAALGG
jgi:hypothetical protein